MGLEDFIEARKDFIKDNKNLFIFLCAATALDAVTTYIGVKIVGIDSELYAPARGAFEIFGPEIGVFGLSAAYIYASTALDGNIERFTGFSSRVAGTIFAIPKAIGAAANTVTLATAVYTIYNAGLTLPQILEYLAK